MNDAHLHLQFWALTFFLRHRWPAPLERPELVLATPCTSTQNSHTQAAEAVVWCGVMQCSLTLVTVFDKCTYYIFPECLCVYDVFSGVCLCCMNFTYSEYYSKHLSSTAGSCLNKWLVLGRDLRQQCVCIWHKCIPSVVYTFSVAILHTCFKKPHKSDLRGVVFLSVVCFVGQPDHGCICNSLPLIYKWLCSQFSSLFLNPFTNIFWDWLPSVFSFSMAWHSCMKSFGCPWKL